MGIKLEYCKNCNCKTPSHHFEFCPYCGQKKIDRLTVKTVLSNVINIYFGVDSKLGRTIFPFIFKPGSVAKAYVEGARQQFIAPFSLYIFLSFLAFLFFSTFFISEADNNSFNFLNKNKSSWIGTDSLSGDKAFKPILDSMNNELENAKKDSSKLKAAQLELEISNIDDGISIIRRIDSLILFGKTNEEIFNEVNKVDVEQAKQLHKVSNFAFFNFLRNKGKGALLTLFSQLSIALLFALPLYTFFAWLVHLRKRRNYAENLVHVVYLFSFALLLALVLGWLQILLPNIQLLWFYLIMLPIYFVISFKTFFNQSYFKSIFKLLLLSFSFIGIIFPVMLMVVFLLTLFQYGQ